MIKRTLIISGLIFVLPMRVWALDLGLTPGQVFSHWININNAIVSVSELELKDKELIAEIGAMEADAFAGKIPGDVLYLALNVEGYVDTLRINAGLRPTKQIQVSDASTTPTDVYIVSSRILLSAVEWIIKFSDSGHLVAEYFVHHEFQDKTPSDVYGLVHLAQRRLRLILGDGSSAPLATKAHR